MSLLVVLGVRGDGQKVLLAIRNMGGESEAAWRACAGRPGRTWLVDTPEFLIIPTARPGWNKRLRRCGRTRSAQRCTVHKHRNLLAHAPERLHEEVYGRLHRHDLRRERGRRWKAPPGASCANGGCAAQPSRDSLEEAGEQAYLSPAAHRANGDRCGPQTRSSACTEFKRASKPRPCCRPPKPRQCCSGHCLASGQITMRKVDGWQSLAEKPADHIIDLAA